VGSASLARSAGLARQGLHAVRRRLLCLERHEAGSFILPLLELLLPLHLTWLLGRLHRWGHPAACSTGSDAPLSSQPAAPEQ
jgi:hypothetical protein